MRSAGTWRTEGKWRSQPWEYQPLSIGEVGLTDVVAIKGAVRLCRARVGWTDRPVAHGTDGGDDTDEEAARIGIKSIATVAG